MLRRLVLLGAAALVFLLCINMAALYDSMTPQGALEVARVARTPAELASGTSSGRVVSRTLCLSQSADARRLRAELRLTLDVDDPLVKRMLAGREVDGNELLSAAFGQVALEQFERWPDGGPISERLFFEEPEVQELSSAAAVVVASSFEIELLESEWELKVQSPSSAFPGAARKVILVTDGERVGVGPGTTLERISSASSSVRSFRSCDFDRTSSRVHLVGLPGTHVLPVAIGRIEVQDAHPPAWWPSNYGGDRLSLPDMPLRLLSLSLPYLLAWLLLRRTGAGVAAHIAGAIAVLLVATATVAALDFAVWPFLDRLTFDAFRADATVSLATRCLAVTALAFWGLNCASPRRALGYANASARMRFLRLLAVALLGAFSGAIAASLPRIEIPASTTLGRSAALSAGLAVVLSQTFAGLGWTRRPAVAAWTAASCLAVLLAVSPAALTNLASKWDVVARATWCVGALAVVSGGALLLSLTVQVLRRRFRRLVIISYVSLGLLLVSPHAWRQLRSDASPLGPEDLPNFVEDYAGLLYIVLLAGLLSDLNVQQRDAEWRRTLGVVFLTVTSYWFTVRLFYLPVLVLVGYALAQFFLFPRSSAVNVSEVTAARASGAEGRRGEGRLTVSAARALRRLNCLLPSGPREEVRAAEGDLAALIAAGSDEARLRFFSVPDDSSHWRDSVRGMVAGTLVGLPWIGVYLWPRVREGGAYGFVEPEYFTSLWIFDEVFGLTAQWALLGFAYVYFFPYFRGRGAVRKAACLWLTLVVPYLVVDGMRWNRAAAVDTLVWGLQVAAVLAVVGVWWDYQSARSGGLRHHEYLEVRGVATLVGLGGVLAIAVITALITAAQTTLSAFLQQVVTRGGGGAS